MVTKRGRNNDDNYYVISIILIEYLYELFYNIYLYY